MIQTSNWIIENVLEYLKNPFNIRFQEKKSFSGAQTHESTILEQYIFRAEIENYFRWFLVQMKTVEFAFEII